MPRTARIIVPGLPHRFTQRGHGKDVFGSDREKELFLRLLAESAGRFGLRVMAYCLMPDHYDLVALPEAADSAARALGRMNSDYARVVNLDRDSRGPFWRDRFASTPLERLPCWRAMAQLERAPVSAGLVRLAEFYKWSSASARIGLRPVPAWLDMELWRREWTAVEWRRHLRSDSDPIPVRAQSAAAGLT